MPVCAFMYFANTHTRGRSTSMVWWGIFFYYRSKY